MLIPKKPWASLIVMGLKDVENRNWRTSHRGPLLIHASKTYDEEGATFLHSTPAYNDECLNLIREGYRFPADFPRGKIIGVVDIADCVTGSLSKWFWGPYGFIIENPERFKKDLPYRGYPGMFDVKMKYEI